MLLREIRGVKVLKSLESRAIRINFANLNGTIRRESKGESRAIRVKFALESNVIHHSKGTTKGIMC